MTILQDELMGLALELGERLRLTEKKIALAESCTGGLVAKTLTDVPGASKFFECGVVSYSNRIKNQVLGVDMSLIDEYSEVSPQVACEMASRVRILASADYGIGITGVAGPGPDGNHPEGEIYIAFADSKNVFVKSLDTHTENKREYNRYCAAINAFKLALAHIDKK